MSEEEPGVHFAASRLQHARENTADYLEVIADLIATSGEARLVDIAARLGVTKATANRTLQRIRREGFVVSQPYRSVFLTEAGATLARESRRRHEIVLAFLKSGGVPDHQAQEDAEGMEHHVSAETLALFERLTALLTQPKSKHSSHRAPKSAAPPKRRRGPSP